MIKKIFDLLHWLRKFFWRNLKIKTFGARVILIDGEKVFLVKHRYGDLWVFPGGGVKKGEEIEDVAKREVYEESGLEIISFDKMLGVYTNKREGKDDTIKIFVSSNFKIGKKHNTFLKLMKFIEIKESGWFDLKNLPKNISRATNERLKEYMAAEEDFYQKEW